MEVRKGYRQTEIGVIPEDWDVKTIEEIADVKGGKRLPLGRSLSDTETPYPYIRVSDMYFCGVSLSEIKYVPVDVFPFIRTYRIFSDDIFITVAGTLGIVGSIPPELNGANLTENADRITNIKCNRDYLLYVLMSPRIQNTIAAMMTVGAQPKLALTRIEKFQIPLPKDDSEQRAIAAALSDVDSLLSALDALIAKKRLIKRGAMQELLTGKERLPGFSGEWEVKKLGDMLAFERPDKYIVQSTEYLDVGIPVLTANKSFILGYTDEELGVYMDLPVIIFDDFTTDSKYVDFPFKVKSSAIKILKPKNTGVNLRFAYERMQLIKFSIGDHKRYYISEYQYIQIPMPDEGEQRAIAEVLTDMDAEIVALEARREKTRLLKQGMMQELLTGKTRLL